MRDVRSPAEISGLRDATLYEVQVRADGDAYSVWTPSAWATPSSAAPAAVLPTSAGRDAMSAVPAYTQQASPADNDCPPTV